MGQIRKQVLQSSFLSYVGFLIGAINTYLFTKQGLFTPDQYGLTQVFISLTQVISPLATLGITGFMNRFFPYYYAHLEHKKNDLLMIGLLVTMIGTVLVFSGCLLFEPLVIKKFQTRSAMLVEYYYWLLVFAFFYTLFMILESYLGTLKRTVLPNFMKETLYRLCVLVLIVLYVTGVISFGTFVVLFCCIYLLIVLIIVLYLVMTKQFYFATSFSVVTKRFRRSIVAYVSYVFANFAITNLARQIDTIALAGAKSLVDAGVYSMNQFTAAILQVPYRGLQAIAGPMIAEHWKTRNYAEISRIYQRSSINLLLIGGFLFINIWINYDDILQVLGIDMRFAAGKTVFLFLSLYNLFELGTGTNAALLSTSPAWRFEFYSGLLLLAISIPLNVFAARYGGMDAVALATGGTLVIYNVVRLIFIRYRFKMWPFNMKTLYSIGWIAVCYLVTWILPGRLHGLLAIVYRSALFSCLFLAGVWFLRLTPDLPQFIEVVKQRLGKKK